MDQTQTPTNDDLQKAIDDITNTTNVDPVFSDPVAAPSSVPEGDTGELSDPIGPFPEASKIKLDAPSAKLEAPSDPLTIPEPATPSIEPSFKEPPIPEPNISNLPPLPAQDFPTATEPENPTPNPTSNSNAQQIKEAALRDLIPLLDKLTLKPLQKFNVYRDIFEVLHDHTVLEPAYKTAKEIPDETKRAEALLYLVETIDNQ